MPLASHFHGNQLLGSQPFEDRLDASRSIAYFCPQCGQIWYRIAVTLDSEQQAVWVVEHVPCARHSPSSVLDWSRIPGTITDAFLTKTRLSRMWWARALEHLPPEALKREFTQLLTYYERQPQ